LSAIKSYTYDSGQYVKVKLKTTLV